jgi:hypothetical protein
MTWSTLVWSHKPLYVEIIGTAAFRLFFFLLPALGMLLFDMGLPSVAVMLKARGEDALPGKRGRNKVAKVLGVAVFNVLLEIALQAGVQLLSVFFLRQSALKITTTLPVPWGMAKHVVYALIIRGCLQYYIHKHFLHSRRKQVLTNWHCCWHHSLPLPFAIASAYDHPVAYVRPLPNIIRIAV